MNKALILLLVILVQSESDGVELPGEGGRQHFEGGPLEGWDGEELPYAEDVGEEYRKRSLTTDALTRRSALDKNFMRFGRGGEGAQEAFGGRLRAPGAAGFSRPGRGVKDNFIRFGRTRPEDFFRAGKSLRENFIRFGRGLARECPEGDLGQPLPPDEPLRRTAKSSRAQENFMRFGRSGRNGTNFLRFGKSPPDDSDAEDSAPQQQLSREKRQARQQLFADLPPSPFNPAPNRPTPFFHPRLPPAPFAPPLDPSWPPSRSIITARLTPFFPPFLPAPKRDHGSNFIRFG